MPWEGLWEGLQSTSITRGRSSLGLKYTAVMVDNSSSAGGGVAIMFTVYPEGTGFWLVTGMQWFR